MKAMMVNQDIRSALKKTASAHFDLYENLYNQSSIMCLIDLPTELLDHIIDLAIPENDCYCLYHPQTVNLRLINRKYF